MKALAPSLSQISFEDALAIAQTVENTGFGEDFDRTADVVRRKTEAMKRSEDHADQVWKDIAMRKLRFLCERRAFITVDDLIEAMGEMFAKTHNLKAAGPMMKNAAKNGWLKKADRVVTCSRPERNGGNVAVWESLLKTA